MTDALHERLFPAPPAWAPTNQPIVWCALCGNVRVVTPDGRGFPPDIAKRKLRRWCKDNRCACDPQYRAGFQWT